MEATAHSDPQNTFNREIHTVIGVTSSKGGTGRSFVTSLLAIELRAKGYNVGILDANFAGSTIPAFFGIQGPLERGIYSFVPLISKQGIKIITPNLLIDDEKNSIIWKEALASRVIAELFKEVEWGELDYLLVDLPPSASEITVSILQSIPFTAVLFVNQPQSLCSQLNSKGIRIVRELGVNIVGVVENMTFYHDLNVNKKSAIFGEFSTDTIASNWVLPVLAHIPYLPENCNLCDTGRIEEVTFAEGNAFIDTFESHILEIKNRQPEQTAVETTDDDSDKPSIDQQNQIINEDPQTQSGTGQYFSDSVMYLIRNKYNVGSLEKPDAQGHFLGQCGDRMQIDLKIVNGRILDAKFLADGCGATQACGSMVTRMACTRTLEDAGKINSDEVINALEGLPDDHLHCAELAVMTLREALIDAVEGHANKVK